MPLLSTLLVFVAAMMAAFAFAQLAREFAQRAAAQPEITDRSPTPKSAPALLRDNRFSVHPRFDAVLKRIPLVHKFQRLMRQAGMSHRVDRLLVWCGGLALVTFFIVVLLTTQVMIALFVAALGILLPIAVLYQRRFTRHQRLEKQLPDFLDAVARAMQAGNSFSGALVLVSKESPDPIGAEFRLVSEEINFGSSVKEGLGALTERVASEDVRTFVIAVQIHQQTGGSLTTLLLKLSVLIRDRQRLRKLGQVLSAEGRLSAWILTVLPFVTAALLYAVNPEFVAILWTTPNGLAMVQGALGLMIVGVVWMWRVIRFRI